MINVENYFRPGTVSEAVELLSGENALALAGGTSVALSRDPAVRSLVDLSEIGELKTIEQDEHEIRLGAMVTMSRIRETAGLPDALVRCALSIGSTPLRNVITVGGELARGVYWNDLPVFLLAAGARVEVASREGVTIHPVDDLFATHPSKFLAGGKLVTRVFFPRTMKHLGFIKYARTRVDYSLLNCAAGLVVENGHIRDARVALGAVCPLPRRVSEVESVLTGAPANGETISRAAEALSALEPRSDFRVSREYQKHLMQVLIRRVLTETLETGNQ